MAKAESTGAGGDTDVFEPPVPEYVDCIVALSVAIGGLFLTIVESGLAGYLGQQDTDHSTGLGAVSGFLYALPGLVVLLFVGVGLYSGLAAVGETVLGFVVALMVLVMLIAATYGAGIGALGGFLGGRIAAK